MSTSETEYLKGKASEDYKHGFYTDIEAETAPDGLTEDVVRYISHRKDEPEWLLNWRLKAFRHVRDRIDGGESIDWAHLDYEAPKFDEISYFSAPKEKANYDSLDEVPDEILETFERLGIPLEEQKALTGVAVDAVMDSVSVATTFKEKLEEKGVIFKSFGEAAREHPEIVREHMGTVIPYTDNLYAALNSAVFSDGSFVYVPEGVTCPMELSTYFRINEAGTGQFERTLIVAEPGAYVSYLEGCTAPMRKENQLHAAVVELISTPRSRTGTRAIRTPARAASTTSSPSAASARATTPRSAGRSWRRGPPSRRSTRPSFSRATTRSASSTRSPLPRGTSRPTRARRCSTSARTRRAPSSRRASRPMWRTTATAAR
jgi:Fe-S cluster assembly protein SufB